MDQLRAPVIRLPEEPPPFAADQPSERRFIYLRPPHMNVIITPARPPGVGAPLLHFPLAPPPAHSVSRTSSLPTVFFRCWSLRRARYYLTAVMGGRASERRGKRGRAGEGERKKKRKRKKKAPWILFSTLGRAASGSVTPHLGRTISLAKVERGRGSERERNTLSVSGRPVRLSGGGGGAERDNSIQCRKLLRGQAKQQPSSSRASVFLGALNKVLFTFDGSGGAEWKGRGHTQGHAGETPPAAQSFSSSSSRNSTEICLNF